MHARDDNGGKQELKLGIGTLSILFTMGAVVVGGSFAVDRLVFQTKDTATEQHAEIEKLAAEERAAFALDLALQKQAAELKEIAIIKALKAQQEASKILNEKQQTLLYGAGLSSRRKAALPSKAVYDFTDEDLLRPVP